MNITSGAQRPNGTNTRALATFFVIASSIVLVATGIVLYFKPAGLMTQSTHGRWVDLHIVMSITVILAACVHLSFNWKTLVHYLNIIPPGIWTGP